MPWFRAHDVAAVATDNLTFEVYPPQDERIMLPVHYLHLVMMGMTQGQNWMLEDLAVDYRGGRRIQELPAVGIARAVCRWSRDTGQPGRRQSGADAPCRHYDRPL